jgi:hypothetical protein
MPRAHAVRAPQDRPHAEAGRAVARPAPLLADRVVQLQRTAGNRAVTQMIARDDGATATAPAPAAPPRLVRRKEVDREIEETISHAPVAFAAWEGTYRWRAKWRLKLDMRGEQAELNVKVRLHSTASAATKRKWSRAIRRKWSGRFAFAVKRDTPIELPDGGKDEFEEMYPINVEVEWVSDPAKAHYTIAANAAGAVEGGRAGLGGTTSMTGWGEADTTDVTHEFGHILGCAEEYFTTNGVDYSRGGRRDGFRDPGGGVMNNPAGQALARNFDTIRKEAAKLRGVRLNKTKVVPWL